MEILSKAECELHICLSSSLCVRQFVHVFPLWSSFLLTSHKTCATHTQATTAISEPGFGAAAGGVVASNPDQAREELCAAVAALDASAAHLAASSRAVPEQLADATTKVCVCVCARVCAS